MAERSMKILWMVLLVVAAYQDFRERQVSVMWMVCGAAAGMIGCCLMAGERYQDMLETGIDAERVSLLMNIVKIQIVRIGKAAGIGIALLILAKLTRPWVVEMVCFFLCLHFIGIGRSCWSCFWRPLRFLLPGEWRC